MKKEKIINSKFVKVKCPKCDNEQVVFGKATTRIKCLSCSYLLAKPSASKCKLRAKVLEIYK